MADSGPNLFVDEDWKARAQREKEELARRLAADAGRDAPGSSGSAATTGGVGNARTPADARTAPTGAPDAPEGNVDPYFEMLMGSLATQAMFALGMISQGADRVVVNLDQARLTIEMLLMLREKMKGNLTPGEATLLNDTVAELQQIFIARMQQIEAQAMRQAGIDPERLKGAPPEA
ncbi:MAG TPA: DUF1844 domain-containing protein [Candidatus Hydrogenedentes bacterium]|nr:DUF1844 domain-containing protein [Candidatus Hydrogenedentota bacterium]